MAVIERRCVAIPNRVGLAVFFLNLNLSFAFSQNMTLDYETFLPGNVSVPRSLVRLGDGGLVVFTKAEHANAKYFVHFSQADQIKWKPVDADLIFGDFDHDSNIISAAVAYDHATFFIVSREKQYARVVSIGSSGEIEIRPNFHALKKSDNIGVHASVSHEGIILVCVEEYAPDTLKYIVASSSLWEMSAAGKWRKVDAGFDEKTRKTVLKSGEHLIAYTERMEPDGLRIDIKSVKSADELKAAAVTSFRVAGDLLIEKSLMSSDGNVFFVVRGKTNDSLITYTIDSGNVNRLEFPNGSFVRDICECKSRCVWVALCNTPHYQITDNPLLATVKLDLKEPRDSYALKWLSHENVETGLVRQVNVRLIPTTNQYPQIWYGLEELSLGF